MSEPVIVKLIEKMGAKLGEGIEAVDGQSRQSTK
jgi:hypothetical protein